MMAMGQTCSEMAELTSPFAKRYADKIGADFILITGESENNDHPTMNKYGMAGITKHYDRSIILDADIFVLPKAVNLFDIIPKGNVGLTECFSRLPQQEWMYREITELMASQGLLPCVTQKTKYWNAGIQVLDRKHTHLYYDSPKHPFPSFWCNDEHWGRYNIERHSLPVANIPETYHWCWFYDRDFELLQEFNPSFIHLAGMGQNVPSWEVPDRQWRTRLCRLIHYLIF
jgi:hypothetical protein